MRCTPALFLNIKQLYAVVQSIAFFSTDIFRFYFSIKISACIRFSTARMRGIILVFEIKIRAISFMVRHKTRIYPRFKDKIDF